MVACGVQRFGDFELDHAAHELRRNGRPVKIEGRAMSLLMLLVERPGELVTRAEIVQRLWGSDAFVDVDAGINTAVRKLRAALRDSASDPQVVRTVQGKGYRFVAPLDVPGTPPAPAAAEASPSRGVLRVFGGAAAVVAIGLLVVALAPRPAATLRVQVAALKAIGDDPGAEAFADRLTYEITGALNESGVQTGPPPRLIVPSFRRSPAELVFGGAVAQEGDRLTARIFLEDTRSNLTLWTRELKGAVGQEAQLAAQAGGAASETIHSALETQRQGGVVVDPQTVALFIRGSETLKSPRPEAFGAPRRAFEQVVARAPDFALGHGNLALALALEIPFQAPPERQALLARAEAEARRAIEIDPRTAGAAYGALGLVQAERTPGDIQAIERPYREGLRNDADDPFLRVRLCDLLVDVGRVREGLLHCLRATALRPTDLPNIWRTAAAMEYAGLHAEAMRQIETALRIAPDDETSRRARMYFAMLNAPPGEALALLRDPARAPQSTGLGPAATAELVIRARASGDPGDVDRATQTIAQDVAERRIHPSVAVLELATLGRHEAALDLMTREPIEIYAKRGLLHPAAAPLRADGRWWAAAARLGLVRYWSATGAWPDFCADRAKAVDCRGLAARAVSLPSRPAGP